MIMSFSKLGKRVQKIGIGDVNAANTLALQAHLEKAGLMVSAVVELNLYTSPEASF